MSNITFDTNQFSKDTSSDSIKWSGGENITIKSSSTTNNQKITCDEKITIDCGVENKKEHKTHLKKTKKLKKLLRKVFTKERNWLNDFEFSIECYEKLKANQNLTLSQSDLEKLNKIYDKWKNTV